jgi:tRNA(Ile)-lysidine synthase
MKNTIEEFILSKDLLSKEDNVLIAVSGGRDSIVLLFILTQLGYKTEVAHCNYKLREEESDKDEQFVKDLCKQLKVPFHVKTFETKNLAKKEGVSIQMKARDLRYEWFESLKADLNIDKIATAHHLDDQLETILINLTRGTGIKGLRGMKEKRGDIIRPLLCVSRDEINDYLYANHIPFREDSSNASGKYFRNKIRHQVIPILKEINPSLFKAVSNTTERLRNVEGKWEEHYETWLKQLVVKENKTIITFALAQEESISFMQQYLRAKGFSYPEIDNLIEAQNSEKGKRFFGQDGWILITGNKQYELYLQEEKDTNEYYLSDELPIFLTVSVVSSPIEILATLNKVYLNADKVQGKLKLRRWKEGDWFVPFGMKGKQKLSDYFINNKFSLEEKEAVWLLCDTEKVVWIVGHRSDERYRIDSSTKNIYIIEVE